MTAYTLLHFLAGLDIFRRGWVLCARVGHEECTLCPGLCTLNSWMIPEEDMPVDIAIAA